MDCAFGQPFDFYAHNRLDSVYHVGPVYLIRVIQSTPATGEPDSGDVVRPDSLLLQWPSFAANFPFGFRVVVADTFSNVMWSTSLLLPREQLLVEVPPLSDRFYFWTLTVVDSFGNLSQSKEAEFFVSSGAPE